MSLLSLLGISMAEAAEVATPASAPSAAGGILSMLPMLVIFVAVFYFLLIRPQSKRAKEHKQLMDQIGVGDEVVTTGGILGRVNKLRDNFVVLSVAKEAEIVVQKASISAVLPKGTLDSVDQG